MTRHFQADEEQGQNELTHLVNENLEDDTNSCLSESQKALVFGGCDGIISLITVLSTVAGVGLSWKFSLLIGTASIVANSLYIGFSEFFSSSAHKVFLQSEKRRFIWEFNHFRDEELKNMVDRFEKRGMGRKDAKTVVDKMAQYESFFVRLMMSEELGSQLTDVDDIGVLLKDSAIMFISFAIFGAIPVMIYLLGMSGIDDDEIYKITLCVSLCILFLLGVAKSTFSSLYWIYSGCESLFLGVVCAGTAYGVAAGVSGLLSDLDL